MQNRNSGGNSPYKFPFSPFSQKWTRKEDEKLRQAVLKYGTQWTLITKRYRFDRSLNSLIKRWHGKLKQPIPPTKNQQQQSQQADQSKLSKSKKTRKQQKKAEKRQDKKQQASKKQNKRQEVQRKPQRRQEKQKRQEKRQGVQKKREKRQEIKQESRQKQLKDNVRARRSMKINLDYKEQLKPKFSRIQENPSHQQSLHSSQQEFDSFSSQEPKQYVFQHDWKQYQDTLLRQLILNQKLLDWEAISSKLKISNIRQIKKRWQIKIYPQIVDSRKIGGCVKYSQEEDAILAKGIKLNLGINQLRRFLPGRTPYSLDARRRRTLRIEEKQVPEMRFWTKRLSLIKFVQKRHEQIDKPAQEEFFLYKSDSQ